MSDKPTHWFPRSHTWETVAVDTYLTFTKVLYRCACGKRRVRKIDGQWTRADIEAAS